MIGRVRRGTRRGGSLLALVVVFGAAFASQASAATIGQTGGRIPCNNSTGVLADPGYVVPAGGGTITSFSFQSNSSNKGQQVDFLLLRPAGGTNYTVIGKTGVHTLAGTGLETFRATIQAKAGDILARWSPGGLNNCGHGGAGTALGGNTGDPAKGDTVNLFFPSPGFDLNESAKLVRGEGERH